VLTHAVGTIEQKRVRCVALTEQRLEAVLGAGSFALLTVQALHELPERLPVLVVGKGDRLRAARDLAASSAL
jgi:hypothetical protein